MTQLDNLRDELENTPMGELRSIASRKYQIAFNPKSTKADIIYAILEKVKGGEAVQAFGAIQPGYARIKLHQTGERSDADVIVSINGYTAFIPMNKEVDVPIKVLDGILRVAEEVNYAALKDYRPDGDGDNVKATRTYSYPFSVLGINPGPDPRPTAWETARERMVAQKRAFQESEGYWPSNKKILSEWLASKRKQNG